MAVRCSVAVMALVVSIRLLLTLFLDIVVYSSIFSPYVLCLTLVFCYFEWSCFGSNTSVPFIKKIKK